MKGYARLLFRGWLIVSLTAWNIRHIAALDYTMAMIGGFGISFVWFGNSRTAAHSDLPWAREVYAGGAALGTLTGMLLSELLK